MNAVIGSRLLVRSIAGGGLRTRRRRHPHGLPVDRAWRAPAIDKTLAAAAQDGESVRAGQARDHFQVCPERRARAAQRSKAGSFR